eukprot:12397775-Alexandrium_andersonii.AAC.1
MSTLPAQVGHPGARELGRSRVAARVDDDASSGRSALGSKKNEGAKPKVPMGDGLGVGVFVG